MKRRKIAIFTGNRAEYGLQFPILKAVQAHKDLECLLLVSGAHLDPNFGRTLSEIKNDGFDISEEIKIDMAGDTSTATALAISAGVRAVCDALNRLRPDIMVVYADRFEGFAAVIAASQMNIPTAHIEGGDITEGGALDDSVRHAMTKLSHIHFTTNLQATNRILAMGEEEWRVHTVGFPAIDLISEGQYATEREIEENLSIDLSKPVVLFTQHSVTTEFELAKQQVVPSIEALDQLANTGVQIVMTYPNNDAGGKSIIEELEKYCANKPKNVQLHRSLGRHLYHGILATACRDDRRIACVGNSSSGIKETPAFCCPTVNIGSRQAGRLRGQNVLDVGYNATAIVEAIRTCLSDGEFREVCKNTENPYYLGDAGKKIAAVLADIQIDQNLLRKRMTNTGAVKDGWYQ